MPTKEQIDLLTGPLALTVGLIVAVLAFATGRVVGKGTADAREAAAVKRGDEWKSASEKQVEANAKMADSLDQNTQAVQKGAETTSALVAQNRDLIERLFEEPPPPKPAPPPSRRRRSGGTG